MAFICGAGLSTLPRNRTESSWRGGGRGRGLDPVGDSFLIKASVGLGGLGALEGPHWAPGAWAHQWAEGFPPCLPLLGCSQRHRCPPPPMPERGVHMCGWVALQGGFMGVGIKYK